MLNEFIFIKGLEKCLAHSKSYINICYFSNAMMLLRKVSLIYSFLLGRVICGLPFVYNAKLSPEINSALQIWKALWFRLDEKLFYFRGIRDHQFFLMFEKWRYLYLRKLHYMEFCKHPMQIFTHLFT